MNKHFLVNAKAYASLVGSVLTAVSATYSSKPLTAVIAALAVLAVWTVPNASE